MPFLGEGYIHVRDANKTGLILAFIAVLLSLGCMAEVMKLLLRAGGNRIRLRDTLILTLVSNAWSSTFPGGAAISTIYQFNTIRNWGVSASISSWFIILSGVLSTSWLVGLALVSIVFLGANFSYGAIAGTTILLTVLALGIWWITANTNPLRAFLLACLPRINRLLRRPQDTGKQAIEHHIAQLDAVKLSTGSFLWVSILSLLNWIFDILAVWLCVWAVTGEFPASERDVNGINILGVTLAFVTVKVVGTAQVTPAGIGPVEASMTAALVAVGLPAATAFGVVLVYRIVSFALITALGWLIYLITVIRGGLSVRKIANPSAPQGKGSR